MSAAIRHPAVAGKFYPQDRNALAREIQSYLVSSIHPLPALGVVVPHAGYTYSGAVAGAVFAATEIPEICILLCPNHTGVGTPMSIMSSGAWETPMGTVQVEGGLAAALKEGFSPLSEDAAAHGAEHAIEVQLPFLLKRNSLLRIVPIALATGQFEILEALGGVVAVAIQAQAAPVLIVASSDMNHYENDSITRVKDRKAIDRLLALDAHGLFVVIKREDVSMCGFGPAVVMLTAARKLGARSAELISYATSGDVSGNRESVVGYAGVVVR